MKWMILFWVAFYGARAAWADSILSGVNVSQKLGSRIAAETRLVDEAGEPVTVRQFLGHRPLLLVPVYYKCPMLCTLTLNDLTQSMNGLKETVGRDFDVLTVSFDPREKPDLAAAKKQAYLRQYRRSGADQGWHFLTGEESSIHELMNSIGFSYQYDPQHDVYAHAAVVVVLTPDGMISRYFLGDIPAVDLKQAIAGASASTIAPPAREVLLYCFLYDPTTGRYSLIISRLLQLLGVMTVLCVGAFVLLNVRRERRNAVRSEVQP